jgi:Zn-dependent M28 family amino/carboxypeptidase
VIGILPGRDPVLRNQTVILGAHYDHLGLGGFGSLDPDSAGRVHNGADDNASGIAGLIQVAARLAASPPARTVVFIAFSGEELGLLGSAHYVKEPIYPLDGTLAMINLDMVGRLRAGRWLWSERSIIVLRRQTSGASPVHGSARRLSPHHG